VRVTALAVACAVLCPTAAWPADAVQRAGDVGQFLLPAGAAGAALLAHDRHGLRQLAEAYASTLAVVSVLKPVVDRTRPNGGRYSFPSGHTASAFAGAAFLQLRYGWRLGAPAYALASFVGYSRVESHEHYTSDVLAGAAIAVAANLVFTRHRRAAVMVTPDLGPRRVGTRVTIAW
jgi:membrane-associated phospholipid phosphatase